MYIQSFCEELKEATLAEKTSEGESIERDR